MNKKKLSLKKKKILPLSQIELRNVIGGDEKTTSNTDCTHFLCCGPSGCGCITDYVPCNPIPTYRQC